MSEGSLLEEGVIYHFGFWDLSLKNVRRLIFKALTFFSSVKHFPGRTPTFIISVIDSVIDDAKKKNLPDACNVREVEK